MTRNVKGSMLTIRIPATLSLAVLFLAGCVSVHANVPEVSLIQNGLAFEALPEEVVGDFSVSRSFSYSHGPINLPDGLQSDVRTVDVSLIANTGITDFSFIRNMRIALSDDVNAPFELASFDRVAGQEDTKTLVLKASPSDALTAFQTDSTSVIIDLTGSLPKVAWSMDVVIRFSGDFQYDL
jgi:hypothetical protein